MNEVIIRLGNGRLTNGFESVTIELQQNDRTQWVEQVSLMAASNIQDLLNRWQLLYPLALNSPTRSPVFEDNIITNFSNQDLATLKQSFQQQLNVWLASGDFGKAIGRLRTALDRQAEIRIAIVSEAEEIWKLPWHFWNLFEDYKQAVEVFAKPNVRNVREFSSEPNDRVDILGVFGRDPQLELDPSFLYELPQARCIPLGVTTLTSTREIADNLDSQAWDMFLFNGHGDSPAGDLMGTKKGIVYLDNDTPIEIYRLQQKLAGAVERGLQMAIFNCCLGLGLAADLSDANIPYLLVMREKIPDRIAQQFLQDLLTSYSQGKSFVTAFSYARSQLILADSNFAKYADWLPVLFHNPLARDASWAELCQPAPTLPPITTTPLPVRFCRYLSQPHRQIPTGVAVSLLASLLVLASQYAPAIVAIEERILDPFQALQAATVEPIASKVTIVNYQENNSLIAGDLNTVPAVSGADPLTTIIQRIPNKFQPSLWVVDLKFQASDDTLNWPNILQSCTDRQSGQIDSIYLPSELKNCNPHNRGFELSALPRQFKNIPDRGLRLNPYFLNKIERVNIADIEKLSAAEIEKLFSDKVVVVGIAPDPKSTDLSSIVLRDALAFDLVARSKDSQHPVPLMVPWHRGLEFMWVFLWSSAMAIAAWRSRRQLWLPLILAVQIVLTGVLLHRAQGVPIAICTLSMLAMVGIFTTIQTLARDRGYP